MRMWLGATLLVAMSSCAHFKNLLRSEPDKDADKPKIYAEKTPEKTVTATVKRLLPLLQLTDDTDRIQMKLNLLSIFQIITSGGTGTCACVRENLVLTAAHVISFNENMNPLDANAEIAIFKLHDDGIFVEEVKRVKIRLVKFNPQYDLALYEIVDPQMRCRPLALSMVGPNFADQYNRFGFSSTWRFVFGTYVGTYNIVVGGQTSNYDFYSMPSALGMSGGPILTNSGELVGVAVVMAEYNRQDVDQAGRLIINRERYVGSVLYDQIKEFLKNIPR